MGVQISCSSDHRPSGVMQLKVTNVVIFEEYELNILRGYPANYTELLD